MYSVKLLRLLSWSISTCEPNSISQRPWINPWTIGSCAFVVLKVQTRLAWFRSPVISVATPLLLVRRVIWSAFDWANTKLDLCHTLTLKQFDSPQILLHLTFTLAPDKFSLACFLNWLIILRGDCFALILSIWTWITQSFEEYATCICPANVMSAVLEQIWCCQTDWIAACRIYWVLWVTEYFIFTGGRFVFIVSCL